MEDNTIPNQINNNIDMFNEHDNQKYFTKIAVLNICTLTEYKLNNIFDYIRKNGVDIMGITETQKADKEINFFNADKAGYKIISHNDNKNAIGKGVMLIIRNNLEKHIFNIEKINGRILIVDFSFKNNKKLRLILFYNLANHRTGVDINNKINMNTHVINHIKIAKSKKMEIICCGDFNLQYRKFKKRLDNKQSVPKMLKIFQKLENLNLWDVHKETYDMDNTKDIMTYFGRFKSRIDYIWISENLFTKTSKAKIINIRDIIKTDHALLTFDFINEDLIYPILQTKKMNTTNVNLIRYIFDFDNTEEKDLLNFQDDLKKVATSFNLNGSIEEKWSFFKNNLLKIKQQHIRSKEIIVNVDRDKTFQHTQLYKDLRYIVYLRRKFKKKLSFEKLALNWKYYNNYLKHLVKRHSIDEVNSTYLLLQHRLSRFLIGQYVKELNEIYDTLFSKFSLEMFNLKNDKIKEAIDKRCADLADNQRRMIDNITENEMKKIFIDRVLIDDEDGNSILVTDENKIKDITKDHFQNAAGSKNRTIDDLQEWSDEYEPIRSINELIYNNCLEPITDDEWDIVIKDLPIKKAVGPTGIAYDEIKKAPSEFNHLLRDIINDVLRNQIMPEDWKLANIYPIPKPKPWGYRLNNTRPITLLETARKVMMKIITKRISKIMVEHQILQGYQYAGLPLNSTFEPLRIINEIIQHSNERDKELWILALDMSKAYDRINVFMLEKAMKRIKFPVELINLLTGLSFGRKNKVFTPYGLTDAFNMQCGIDQGEIISPLLWIIYYDPLLTKIKNSNLGYDIDECIKMLKTQNFSIAINDTIDKMEIIGGNILIKDILPEEIYFKNLRSIKKLNIMFADQILTLDGKNLLTLKEILGKRFKKFFSPNRSLIEKSWKIIEDCILDNNEVIKRRISIEATNKIGTSFAHNLKGTILTKMNLDSEPINNGFIFGKKKLHNDIILVYGKNYNLGSNDIVLEHYITVNNPDDLFMGLKKCLGCFLDETSTLGPLERIHKQSNCLVKLRIEDVYFLENYLHSHAMIIHETDSYIVPDIIQSHIESNIWHEHNFIIEPMLFKQDDIRLNIFESNMQKSTHNCIEKYVKKEKFNKNLTIEKLNVINYKLIQQLGEQIFVYIDGSVINNGTENIDGIAGLHFYDKDHKLIDEFYVNIEHWISPSKAEVTSFIIALIIVHNISNVEIITDNEFIFNYFNDIICKTEIYNTRKLLKTQNNIYIWALIRQFIDLNEIIIPKITKIKAHDDDLYHNFLDQQIKGRYSDRNRVYSVNFNFFQLDKIEYMLTWNNIIIEKPIRRFIRYYNEILNLEKFFNLQRNRKYTIDSVEWAITFEFLKENENVLQTNFHTTKRRRYKIKNLIEEIPTVEQRKLTNFDIYKDWKCPVCERKKETFGHVWRCYSNRKRMRNIIYYSIICLIEKIKEYDIYTFDETKIIDLFINESFGEVKVNNNKLTFVDIIKGLFPKLLADFLRQEIKMTKVHIFETGVKFLDFVFDSTHKIWVDRCDLQKDKEISLGVTKEDKKHYSYDKNIVKKDINHKVYQKVEGLLNNIYFNIEPLDFIVRVNHYPGSSGI
ncbi:hypothetical protein GLOIN_2v1846731 [Rhizophagus irregularis DAOM 181602=DAOM 197198]|nr:hypothetical protein GLOIN_2v1846731 [Rhizophagus irregularis DAOM 181602=DAOM 197198]